MRYQGFFKDTRKVSQGVHGGDAIDISAPWGTRLYAPFAQDDSRKRKFVVIRANRIDPNASNVRYTAIQDVITKTCFGYFHTGKTVLKTGQWISSGTYICETADNGVTDGAHLHLAVRNPNFGTKVNPLPFLYIKNNQLKGFPPQSVDEWNIPIGSTLEIISTSRLNIRTKPTLKGEIVGQLNTGEKVITLEEHVVADGYQWEKIEKGWIAVMVMSNGSKYVKIVDVPLTCEEKLEKAIEGLKTAEKLIEVKDIYIKALETENLQFKTIIDQVNNLTNLQDEGTV